MNRVLFLLPDLGHTGAAAQLIDLLEAWPPGASAPRVILIGPPGAWAERVRKKGVVVDAPGSGRWFNWKPYLALRTVVQEFSPTVIHAWRLPSLRLMPLSGFKGRVVLSPCLRPGDGRGLSGWLDRRMAGRAHRVLASGPAEARWCRTLGVAAERIVEVPPGVFVRDGAVTERSSPGPCIVCVGRLEAEKGFREAIWSLDMLRYIHDDLRMQIAGEGPDRARLDRFAAGVGAAGVVRFLGAVDDAGPLLRSADVVWAPGRADTGARVVLEAMAAGRPVVAHRWPRLDELVRDGETGFLVPPGDRTGLARRTQTLLTDPALRDRMGTAARKVAAEQYRPGEFARRCFEAYND